MLVDVQGRWLTCLPTSSWSWFRYLSSPSQVRWSSAWSRRSATALGGQYLRQLQQRDTWDDETHWRGRKSCFVGTTECSCSRLEFQRSGSHWR